MPPPRARTDGASAAQEDDELSQDREEHSASTISDGSYPLSRTLFIYVKKQNLGVTQGLQDFVNEFVSDAATGRGGYLQGRGLIPLPQGMHESMKDAAQKAPPMGRPAA